jgi:hypothetical protein
MSPRLAVIGPGKDSVGPLTQAIAGLLADADTRQIIYLGTDDAIDHVVATLAGASHGSASFLGRAAELACSGDAEAIDALLATEQARRQLRRVRKLPEPPARAVEMLEQWIVLGVHDKAVLDEEDIANAHVILYGKASQPTFKSFGPRCFFTPGPVSAGRLGVLELQDDGELEVQVRDLDGKVLTRDRVQRGAGKVVVTG